LYLLLLSFDLVEKVYRLFTSRKDRLLPAKQTHVVLVLSQLFF
jgi:hypothetical protein